MAIESHVKAIEVLCQICMTERSKGNSEPITLIGNSKSPKIEGLKRILRLLQNAAYGSKVVPGIIPPQWFWEDRFIATQRSEVGATLS